MLSKKTIASIALLTKQKVEDITAAIADTKEVDLTLDETLVVLTPAEKASLETQMKDTGKGEHIKAGKEIAIKELKEATGIEFAGKDPAKFISEYKDKVLAEAKLPVETKVTELNTQIALLKEKVTEHEGTVKTARQEAAEARQDALILSSLPANRNPAFSDADYLLLVKNRVKAEVVDGKTVYKDAKGEVVRDPKTAVPLDLGPVIAQVFTATPAWMGKIDPKTGRGGGSSGTGEGGGGGDPTKWSEAKEQWEAQGKSINASEFSTWVGKLSETNKAFEMDLPGAEPAPKGPGSGI